MLLAFALECPLLDPVVAVVLLPEVLVMLLPVLSESVAVVPSVVVLLMPLASETVSPWVLVSPFEDESVVP